MFWVALEIQLHPTVSVSDINFSKLSFNSLQKQKTLLFTQQGEYGEEKKEELTPRQKKSLDKVKVSGSAKQFVSSNAIIFGAPVLFLWSYPSSGRVPSSLVLFPFSPLTLKS